MNPMNISLGKKTDVFDQTLEECLATYVATEPGTVRKGDLFLTLPKCFFLFSLTCPETYAERCDNMKFKCNIKKRKVYSSSF